MNFCTNCGKPLDEGAMFCTSCGCPVRTTVVAAPAEVTATSAAAAPAPATVVPVDTPVVSVTEPAVESHFAAPTFSQPHESSSNLRMILLIMAIVVVVGVVGTVLLLGRMHRGEESAAKDSSVARQPSAADVYIRNLNLAAYPGATAAAVTSDTENVIAAFQTRDTAKQVIGYYKVRFPISDTKVQDGQTELRAALPNGEHIVVRATEQTSGTLVNVIRAP